VQDVLIGCGHRAVAAESGEEALELLDHQAFDVVLMDIKMPSMSGIEVVRRIRNSVGPSCDTPVIAFTSEISRTKADYLAMGFNDFISKPFSIPRLLQALHECVRPYPTGIVGSAA
jgi:CheY-like chemotaxis protein